MLESELTDSTMNRLAVPVVDASQARWVAIAAYRGAQPWPHLVMDGLFDRDLVAAAEAEQTAVARTLRAHASRRQIKAERSLVEGSASERLMAHLDSPEWVRFLEALTGVPELETDPLRFWAGLHVGPPGSFQAVHRDFQRHPATGRFHRVNVLLYLTSGWSEEDGAALELWTPDASRRARSILPVAGRLVVFESHAATPHAVARHTASEPTRLRLALAAYYYSRQPPPVRRRTGNFVQPRLPGQSQLSTVIDLADAARGATKRLGVLPARLRQAIGERLATEGSEVPGGDGRTAERPASAGASEVPGDELTVGGQCGRIR